MKNKKNIWRGIILGVLLCAVLVVFIGGGIAAQTGEYRGAVAKKRVLNRAATVNDVYEVSASLEERLIAMEQRQVRIEQKIDLLQKTVKNGFNVVERMLASMK
ncbi:MAG: hypothetical protein JXO51_12305 [Candidatus Aminicenantes bacterium]|nr:hypothetical protein [Candidatus Aminicenantes bacterium]